MEETRVSLIDKEGFELAQRTATVLSKSDLVPQQFKNNLPNCIIAINMASRIGADPLMVMQNMYIVHGKPSWSSTFLIAAINSCGKFKAPLRFETNGEGDQKQCIAWTIDLTGEKLESPAITIQMAKEEGWLNKAGSKWKTMPELMLRYRAAAFFSRLYCPEITMGMHTVEEIQDAVIIKDPSEEENNRILNFIEKSTSIEQLKEVEPHLTNETQKQKYDEKLNQIQGKLGL